MHTAESVAAMTGREFLDLLDSLLERGAMTGVLSHLWGASPQNFAEALNFAEKLQEPVVVTEMVAVAS